MNSSRREFLYSGGLALGAMAAGCGDHRPAGAIVDDLSGLNAVVVDRILRPTRTSEIQSALVRSRGPVSIGGGRYSMGGQVACGHSLHIDMRSMRRLVWLDRNARAVRVQAGMSWRDVQDAIDPHGLSVKVMQSYSNFTVGGSVSVNCHGRYVGKGPISGTVRALQLVTADGQIRELSSHREPDLFGAVLGGYGGLGVVTEVELDLDSNDRIGRRAERLGLEEYPSFFLEQVLADPAMVLHNADLMPPKFDAPLSIGWRRTDAPLTQTRRLVPRDLDYSREQTLIWSATELPGPELVRDRFLTEKLMREPAVTWRNHQASLDLRSLEPRTRLISTYLLQEYFVPVGAFPAFTRQMRRILIASQANILNVSIRHSLADSRSLLRWAQTDVFSFVVYHKQRSWAGADAETGRWTRRLVAAALDHGGRYYLPYRLHATPMQFRRAYPEHIALAQIKEAIDPRSRFRNRLWDKYLSN